MHDSALTATVRQLCADDLEQRRLAVRGELARVMDELTFANALRSGRRVVLVTEIFRRELRTRVHLARGRWEEALATISGELDPETERVVREELLLMLQHQTEELRQVRRSELERFDGKTAKDDVIGRDALDLERTIVAHLDMFFRRRRAQLAEGQGTNVTVHGGTIGAIVTAPGAAAHVTQMITQSDRAVIESALDLVEQAVAAMSQLAHEPRENMLDVVRELKAETKKERPNWLRLSTLAGGIATAIQTLGSAPQALATLRAGFAAIGITLP